MKIDMNGKPFEGSPTNTVANVQYGIREAAGECAAALGRNPGSGAKIVATDIEGLPGLVFTAEYPAPAAKAPKPKPAKPDDPKGEEPKPGAEG